MVNINSYIAVITTCVIKLSSNCGDIRSELALLEF